MARRSTRTARSKRRVLGPSLFAESDYNLRLGLILDDGPLGRWRFELARTIGPRGWVQHDSAQASAIEQPELAKRRCSTFHLLLRISSTYAAQAAALPASFVAWAWIFSSGHRLFAAASTTAERNAIAARPSRPSNSSPSRSAYKHPGVNDPHVTADKSVCPKLTGAMGFAGVVAQGLRSDMVGTHAFDPDPVHSLHAAGRSRRDRPTEPSSSCRTLQPRRQPNRGELRPRVMPGLPRFLPSSRSIWPATMAVACAPASFVTASSSCFGFMAMFGWGVLHKRPRNILCVNHRMVRASRLLVAYNLHTTRDKLARVSSYKIVVHTTPHCTPIQELCEILSEHAKNCRHLRLDSERWTVNCPDNGDVVYLQLSVYYDMVEDLWEG
jgi:hypothetical protein